ncbi:hypothetical protein [Actinoplanes flavus]|uniref:Uncharacterized protein n=1 Tax=Actinoplanes flavus TaxID=2820290 RepID=A0ABS3UH26_9ACTN|nr:hypothetical protein [Actinoplanes flavus]MBO3737756.1 hypothetical protein [Actinoplanes flavus]
MVDYWGAKADPNYGYSPYSGQLHYGQHESSSEPFTSKAGDGNNMTIEEVRARIHNMHPEQISALGDQWQNAWTVLDNVRTYVLRESTLLHDERWESPQARDAFLRKGPGEALAYLDVWMDAVQKNVTALRHLTQITIDARRDIDTLWTEYEQALKNAQKVDFAGQLSEWVDVSRHYGFETWDDSKQQQVKEQVDQVTRDFQRRAQELAYRVGNEHYEYTSMVNTGVGPPYRPMNVVLNTPGKPALPNAPSLPPGAPNPGTLPPGVPPPPPPAQQNQPPAPPPPAGDKPTTTPPKAPSDAPEAPAIDLPSNPGTSNPVNPPVNPPVLATLPPPPPAFTNPGVKPPATSPGPGPAPSQLNKAAAPPAPNTSKPPNPGQLTKNAFTKGPGGGSQLPPGSTQPPGKTLRRPNVPADPSQANPGRPQPGRPGERGRDDRSGQRTPVKPTAAGDDAFGRSTGNTAPPVLKNPTGDRDRVRPGSRQEMRPTAPTGGDTTPRDGTTPPVLQRPTRTSEPPTPSRSRTAPTTTAGPSWLGAEQARAAAGNPIIDAPAPPPAGSRVSHLEEVPKELRSRAATSATGPARVEKPGTVSPELNRRRVGDERTAGVHPADDEARGVVTDEQAFEVRTPGGGVVTGKREEAAYEPEIRRILGGR